MKYQAIDQTYVVLTQEKGLSKITGQPYTKVTLVGTHDRDEYTTYIDTANHNHSNWHHILMNPEHGFVLKNLRVKLHKERLLVDADSKPIIAAEHTEQSYILDELKAVWAEQDHRQQNRFRDLFE
jgi:hypothetical protein